MNLGFTRLNEILETLVEQEVRISLTSGDDIEGWIKEICPDAVILHSTSGKVGIIAASCITMILEGPFTKEEDIVNEEG